MSWKFVVDCTGMKGSNIDDACRLVNKTENKFFLFNDHVYFTNFQDSWGVTGLTKEDLF